MLNAAERPTWREEYGGRWGVELAILAALLAVAGAMAPLVDPDLPIHLALGEWIARHGAVPVIEPFAWTREGEPFFAYSWLPEVVFYGAYRAAGTLGLQLLQGAAVFATLAAMVVLARLARWSVWTAIVLTGIHALLAMVLASYLRPHMVLWVCVPLAWGVAIRLLESERPWRWAAGLLVLSAVAANSHLLFPLVAAPWMLLAIRWPGSRRAALLVGATVLGWLFTPYVVHWPEVFALNFNDNALFAYPTPISELTPGVQSAVSGRSTLLAIAVALGLLPWVVVGLTWRERLVWGLVWVAGMFAFALAVRAIFLWWLLMLPVAARVIEPLAQAPRRRMIIIAQRVAVAVLVLVLVWSRARAVGDEWSRSTTAVRSLPARPASQVDPITEWLSCHTQPEQQGKVFTVFLLGTYLTWQYPVLSYSIDGRNIFPDSVAAPEGYVLVSRQRVELGPWRSAELAIVPFQYPVAAVLDTASGWQRAAVVAPLRAEGDTVGLWVTDRWWSTAGVQSLPRDPDNLPPGNAGVRAACMNGIQGRSVQVGDTRPSSESAVSGLVLPVPDA